MPRIAFVNKMDRVGADFFRVQRQIGERLKGVAVPIQIPIGAEDHFQGVVDLVKMKAILWDDESQGVKFSYKEIPGNLVELAREWHDKMVEAVAEASEELLEKYLTDHDSLTEDEIKAALRKLAIANEIVPMLCDSAFKNKGAHAGHARRRDRPPAVARRRARDPRPRPPRQVSGLAIRAMTIRSPRSRSRL